MSNLQYGAASLLCCSFIIFRPFVVLASVNTSAIPLPTPEGPYASSITVKELTDKCRPNPSTGLLLFARLWSAIMSHILREDCVNIGEIDYKPAAVAEWFNEYDLPSPDLTKFPQLKFSGGCLETPASKPETSLLIWTGGFYASRLQYSAIAQAISSWGYRVVTIDHLYDASIVEFSDGSIVYSAYPSGAPSDATSSYLQSIRAKDIKFVTELSQTFQRRMGCTAIPLALRLSLICFS